MGGFAWVTLATNDSYSLGALVLAHSLRNANTAHKLAVLITPGVSPPMKEQLSTVFDVVKMVDVLDSKDEAHLALMKRPELGVTFTKIHCWRLTEFEKCVFLDADTLVIKNCDELFDREELSAAPDVGWPDCFNTGVFVFKPSIDTFDKIIKFSLENGSFDGGDQGLLNQFFGDWARKDINKHLPFVYNLTSVALYSYIPAFKQYGSDVRIVHFIGSEKPWLQQLNPQTKSVCTGPGTEHLAPMLQIWWDIFCDKVHPSMTSNLECDSGMRNDEIEACVNDNLTEPEPEITQSFPPYVDKDDSRQINLPYQHFDVKSSTGELLNITYLEKREQEMKEREEETEKREEVEEGRTHDEDYRQSDVAERKEEVANDVQVEENVLQHPVVEEEQSSSSHKNPPEEQQPEPEVLPFNRETFFPDETCVQKYLQKNVMTYQPLDCREEKQDIVNGPEQVHHLPRFLSIAEDDKRQSLNVYSREDPKPSQTPPEDVNHHHSENENQSLRKAESLDNWHLSVTSPEPVKTKWKSMSHLGSLPETKLLEKASFWKSHPSLNDPNRRYSMPKLKPIIPKQSNSQTYATEVRPKVTQYTEFHMSCDYSDGVPRDTLGFIERHMLEEITQRIPNVGMERLKTLSHIFPLEAEGKTKPVVISSRTDDILDEVDCDLSSCERQRGNQPLHDWTKKRSNSCFLPVLKPIRPSKNEEPKRSGKSRSRLSKERGTKAKIESRKAREKAKSELNIKPSANPNSVEDILKKLINFSKDYQVYFTEYPMVQNKGNERLLSTVFKNGYSVSTKDSPRIQYDKEFEELQDPPLSPSVNGYSGTKKENTIEIQQTHPEDPLPKIASTIYVMPKLSNGKTNGSNGTITSTDSTELEERNGIVRTVEIPPKLSKEEAEMVNDSDPEKFPNECQANGVSSKSEIIEPTEMGTVKTNGMDMPVCQRNGTRSPGEPAMTYASVVKQGLKTLQTKPVTSETAQPKEKKIATKSRQSRTGRRKRKNPPMTSKQSAPIRAPPPEEAETVEKPVNFSLLPEDASRDVTVKSAKRKPKPVPSQSFPRGPAGKANQDRRVVESLPTVDVSHVDKSGIAGAIAKLSIQPAGASGAPSEAASSALEDCVRRQNWEMGTMDYMGRDSFDNIWSKICETIDGKVAQKDLNPDGASTTPSTDAATSQKHDVTPEKSQVQPQDSPKKMAEESNVVPPGESDASPSTIGSEITAKASDIASKATEALEAFGKLFVSGPVPIKSEVTENVQKTSEVAAPTEKKEQPQGEEGASTERKKSTEQDDEGKQKKGVINKILELVGVGKPETSTAVFYDTEQPQDEQPKEDKGKSIFYDTETPPGDHTDKEEQKLSTAEAEGASKVRAPSPVLSLKTSPGTEVVCPTPPSTPMTPQVVLKDDKMLTVDDEIKATPPVTDKKFDEVAKVCERSTIKSQVDSIIEEAKKVAQGQLQESKESKEELKTSASPMSTALVPRLNDALEVFGKLFVSGPVTIKSEVPEEDQKSLETPKKDEVSAKVSEETLKSAIPMPEPPTRMVEPAVPVTPEVVLATTETEPVLKSTEPAKSVLVTPEKTEAALPTTPQTSEVMVAEAPKAEEPPAPKVAEPAAPTTPQTSEVIVAEAPKAEEPPAPKVAEPAAPTTPQTSEAIVAEAPKAEEPPAPKVAEPAAPTTPQTSEAIVAETPKAEEPPAPKVAEPAAPTTPQTSEAIVAEAPKAEEPPAPKVAEPAAPTTPQTSEAIVAETPKAEEPPAPKVAEPAAPTTPQTSEGTVPEAPKAEEPPTSNITELAAVAVEAVAAMLTKATESSATSGTSLTDTGAPVATQPPEPSTPLVTDSSAPVAQPGTTQPTEPTTSPVTPQKTETATPATPPSTPKTELPPTQKEPPKPSEQEPSATQLTSENANTKDPKKESPSIIPSLSKANEALEAFGKHFVSGPVIIKSEEPEPAKSATPEKPESEPVAPAKDPATTEGHSKTAEALEVFGKSFVSGPVTVKSIVPEAVQATGEVATDAVHRVFQSKPEDEPIYSNIEEVEEIKVTSEEDRRKEKPQTSKLTEQILKAIPPELRKPFSDAGADVSPEVAQLLSSAEQQTTSILLDKPAKEEAEEARGESESSGPSVPPVPPRRNRSKGRDAPQPPPKKKGKNGKD